MAVTSEEIAEILERAAAEAFPFLPPWRAETKTAEPEAPATPAAEPKPAEEKTALDEAKDMADERSSTGGAEPPKEGHCRECKRLRKLNRLRLCYPCFVELVLMDEAKKRGYQWKPGDKHPDWCSCEGLGEHPERDGGAWRGN
jgi:hypothetical protein